MSRRTVSRRRTVRRLERTAAALRAERDALAADLAAQQRVNDQLSRQLFNAMGYDEYELRRLGIEPTEQEQEVAR